MSAERLPCRKCLLSDEADRTAYAAVADYIASLPEERKVDKDTYRERLETCRRCEHLKRALCVKCGCYVEVRCVKRGLLCPDVPPRWT